MSSEPKVHSPMDLKHQFLIAMPAMADTNFERSVVYVCDHSDRGALGLVINRPTDLTLGKLFDRVDICRVIFDDLKLSAVSCCMVPALISARRWRFPTRFR